jgi:MFS family permease
VVPVEVTRDYSQACQALGYFLNYCSISGIVWVLAIAISLNQILIQKHHHIERYHKMWFFLAMILPAIIAVFPFITKSYGLSAAWCTLKEDKISRIWKFFMFYLPTWLLILIIIVIYIKVGRNLNLNPAVSEDDKAKRTVIKRIIAYPLIMIITFLPITCVRVIYITTGQSDIPSLSIAYFCYGIHGLLNSFVYGYNDIVIKNIKESFLSQHINQSIVTSEI